MRGNAVQHLSDGEIFYHLKNGIRHTGMPAWSLPERKLWQLSAYLRHLPLVAMPSSGAEWQKAVGGGRYVGSLACRECHREIYDRWRKTRMANVVQDPRTNPQAIIPDLSKPDPLLTFSRQDPVGFRMGEQLADYWTLEEHELGQLSFTHFPDGTAHKNRMQGNDFVQSLMYTRGVSCFSCHDAHGSANEAMLLKPANELCSVCHGANAQNGPHAPSLEAHTHHRRGSPGSECIACHMPKIEQTIADVNVRAHTFRFISPAESEALKMPNACNLCHADKTTAWATAALRGWDDRSPWRVGRAAAQK